MSASKDGASQSRSLSVSARSRLRQPRAQTHTGQALYLPQRRAELVVDILGNQRTADLLGVSKSQPSRWKSAKEAPSPSVARRLVDMDYVLGRLLLVWDESLVADWLTSPNGFLDGATPLEEIEANGPARVVEAIEAEAAEVYA